MGRKRCAPEAAVRERLQRVAKRLSAGLVDLFSWSASGMILASIVIPTEN